MKTDNYTTCSRASLKGRPIPEGRSLLMLLMLLLFCSTSLFAQRKIAGKVTEAGSAVPGVTVTVKGSNAGTVTDIEGNYSLQVDQNATTLVYSFIGLKTQEVVIGSRSVIDVSMEPDIEQLDEVIVIGYGSREKKDVTTAVSQISSKEITQNVSMTPEAAMQGRMSGVQVSGATGNPFSRPTIRIRGVNSWGVASPLYVIDGIPITEFGAGVEQNSPGVSDVRGPMNIMSLIDPSDIETITVLKDASAAAIYGVRAANGVVLITTKKGRGEKPTIEFNTRIGVQNIYQELDVLNVDQYVAHANYLQNQFPDDQNFFLGENKGVFEKDSSQYLGNNSFHNWQDAVKNKNAITQDYNIKLLGATDKSDYYFSVGYTSMDGTIIGNKLDRYSTNIKLNTEVKKWLKTGVNYRLSYADGIDNVGQREPLYYNASTPPWQPIKDPNNVFGYQQVVGGLQEDGTYTKNKLFGSATRNNFSGITEAESNLFKSLRNMGSAYLELKPITGLSIKGTFSVDRYNSSSQYFMDYRGSSFRWVFDDPRGLTDPGVSSEGQLRERELVSTNVVKEISVNYTRSFGDHNFDLLLNTQQQDFTSKNSMAQTNFVLSREESLRNFGGENKYSSIGSGQYNTALQGWLGRLGYNFSHKYYLDATVRYDGSSRFDDDFRWGVFPSASAAWRLSEESFMNQISWLDDLKLRAGWGQLGNQEVPPNQFVSNISGGGAHAFGTTSNGLGIRNYGGISLSLPTPELQWERTSTLNLGFDATLFRGVDFSAEYFNKITSDILQQSSPAPSAGLSQLPWGNVAKVQNQGFEFSLNYRGSAGKLNYSVGGNFTKVKNEVLETYEGSPQGSNIEVGKPMFYARALQVGGILQTPTEVAEYLAKTSDPSINATRIAPGDFWFIDQGRAPGAGELGANYILEADGVINGFDAVMIGNTIPSFYYGFHFNLEYSGFDLAAQFTGVGDVMKYNWIRKQMEYSAFPGSNITTNVLTDSWSESNMGGSLPRIVATDPSKNLRTSSHYWEDADYLRLANLQVGYTLPKSTVEVLGGAISYARIYIGASNLMTITRYSGFDPETGAGANSRPSDDVNSNLRSNNPDDYPTPRVFFAGLSVKF